MMINQLHPNTHREWNRYEASKPIVVFGPSFRFRLQVLGSDCKAPFNRGPLLVGSLANLDL